jgi:ATP-dependent Lon protease
LLKYISDPLKSGDNEVSYLKIGVYFYIISIYYSMRYLTWNIKLSAINHINHSTIKIYAILYGIMNRINDSYNHNLISKHKYNTILQNLENILTKYDNKRFSLKNDTIKDKRLKLDASIDEIKKLCLEAGAQDIVTLIFLFSGIKSEHYYEASNILFFINEIFHPYKCTYIPQEDNTPKTMAFNPLGNPTSLISHINGCNITLPLPGAMMLVIDGYFIEDPLNILRLKDPLQSKNSQLTTQIMELGINKSFKCGYINQLSLRDFILYDVAAIIDKCNKSYAEISRLKTKTISALVKEFLNIPIDRQREYLTLFLLMKDDIETQYLAYLMYDMISNESGLLKPQPLSEQVYNSLHWTIQKLFKIAIKKVDVYNKSLINFKEDDIPYEKRIALMKTDDLIKNKAMEKYKEVLNKGNDNTNKAQQYLDGILKIPFGTYTKEYILAFLDNYKIELIAFSNASGVNITTSRDIKASDIDSYIKNTDTLLLNAGGEPHSVSSFKLKQLYEIAHKMNGELDIGDRLSFTEKTKKMVMVKLIQSKIDCVSNAVFSKYTMEIINQYTDIRNKWLKYKTDIQHYIANVGDILDDAVYSQSEAKNEIKRIIAQWINGEMKGYCFGFEGPPGTGKTSLAKKGIAQCLIDADGKTRPFAFIPIGGSSNGATLEGHGYTYVGSTWGKIVEVLRDTECMNPIIYIDELDKISKTENGREIIGILTHMTDSSQNDEFYDKYFSGVKIDLSKVLFIFSYNDASCIDSILADRIHRVKFNNLSRKEKIYIANNYLLPEFLEMVGFAPESISFTDTVLEYIIDSYTFEAGIRRLKQKLFEIIREINLQCFMEPNKYTLPIVVSIELVNDIFSDKPKIILTKIADNAHIGLVNGLYATSVGNGGITVIEAFKTPSDAKLSLMLTGNQGEVMQESVKCAKTIAWNILPKALQDSLKKECNWGIHVHFPEAATPKDGPSAGGAITLAIVSLLCGIPVKNTIALTGEIDLNGSIHMIGGLDNKIDGGKMAGVKVLLYPHQNQQDIDIIRNTTPEILEGIEIRPIKNIWEVLEYCLEENAIQFTHYASPSLHSNGG